MSLGKIELNMVWYFTVTDNNVVNFREFSGIVQLIFPSILLVLL